MAASKKPVAGDVRRRRQPEAGARLPLEDELPTQDSESPTNRRRSSGKQYTSVPHARGLLLGVVAFYVIGLSVVGYLYTWLPPALDMDAPLDRFSEARARVVLENIMSFGYHPVGTRANEELIPNYLISEIEKIRASAGPDVNVELEVQRPSGAFGLNFMAQFQNIYANVTNILVRVSPTHNTDALQHSLMLSSHYDAAIGGAAASDDGVNIAIMLELLRLFTVSPPRFGALVFNFNGAEETIMQAAHGFITQHAWTESIRAFINLEAAGAGGRELLFQTGSDELALAYAQGAQHPHASIVAQEIFQSGFITADTDYRIYRDFGAVAGMDFAYIENGYVYHTSLDDISRIQHGAVQRLGDNVVGVVQQLVNEPGRLEKVAATPESSNTLFFDVFGSAMITMSKTTAYTICAAVLALALLYLAVSPISARERLSALSLVGRCAGAGFAATLLTALVLSLFAPLSWYSQLKLGAVMFVLPVLTGMLDQLIKYLEQRESISALWQLEESLFEGVLLLWVLALGMLMSFGTISSYLPALWILFPLIGQILCHTLQRLQLLSTGVYVTISIAAIAVPVLHTASTFAIAFVFFMPLMGRSGTQLPPDLLVGVFFAVFVSIVLSYSGRFFCFFPVAQLKRLRKAFAVVWIATIVVGSFLNPYTDDCPKRVMVQHVHRETVLPNGDVKTDAGLWLNALDFRGLVPLKPHLSATQWRHLTSMAAPGALAENAEVYGHMPWALPVKNLLPEKSSWYLPAAAPVIPHDQQRANLEIVSSKYSAETDRRVIHLHFTGPSHMNLFIDARNTTLTSWSIGNGVNGPAPESDDSYILQFCSGTTPSSFHFWIEAKSAQPIDAVVVGHHIELVTPEMREFKDALPSWYTTMDAVSTWRTMQL